MSEMVERVARAIASEIDVTCRGGEQIASADDLRNAETDIGHVDLVVVARAAIAAMRDASDVVLTAAPTNVWFGQDKEDVCTLRMMWEFQIDAALGMTAPQSAQGPAGDCRSPDA